ncbi:MAG: thioester domain-containing protein [Bacilli bacterium]|nr:thioester domain-containing protein [Bacilli bacterium]
MKMFKKTFSLLCVLLMSITFVFMGTVSAASNTAKLAHTGASPKYIGNTDVYNLKFDDGTVVYCYDGADVTWPPAGVSYTRSKAASAGVRYILEHGSSSHQNSQVASYITQGAIWWFRADNEGGRKLNEEFTTTGAESVTGIRNKIIALANEAKSASGTVTDVTVDIAIKDADMKLSDDKNYYVSEEFTATVKGASSYKVDVTGVTGAEAMTTSGNVKTTFNANEKFLIRIPATAVNKTASVNVKVSASGNKQAYVYTPSGSYQSVVGLFPNEDSKTAKLTATVKNKDQVCVDYVIVGNVIPDPAKTDPTPGKNCYDKGTKYDQEKGLTTRQENCKFIGWHTKKDLTGKWTNGTALNNDLTLYGAWDCGTPIVVPATAANTPLVILGVGLAAIATGLVVYFKREKKLNANK